MPKAIPIPQSPRKIGPGESITVDDISAPVVLAFDLAPTRNWFQKGSNVTFTLEGSLPTRLGIYGPNPSSIGAAGRMCSPKAQEPDAAIHSCQGNFAPGRYYLVIRSNVNGPPLAGFTLATKVQSWKVFS